MSEEAGTMMMDTRPVQASTDPRPATASWAEASASAGGAPHAVIGVPRRWLRLEGLAALVAGVVGYLALGGDPVFLVPALLLVDLSMIAYVVGPHPGSVVYNIAHNWALGLSVLGVGWLAAMPLLLLAGAVLVAHVGLDRFAGYGLKYATSFADTHLGRIGR
jgi:hypothetical protein